MTGHSRFGGRTLARTQAMQLLFQSEMTGYSIDELLQGTYALEKGPLDSYAESIARGTSEMLSDLDAVISMVSVEWKIPRMSIIDRNLMRLALYEMLKEDNVDIEVAIDECVEIAKHYSDDNAPRFVNGVLGRIADLIQEGKDVVALGYARHEEQETTEMNEEFSEEVEAQDSPEVQYQIVEEVHAIEPQEEE